eukprot:sb/3462631/
MSRQRPTYSQPIMPRCVEIDYPLSAEYDFKNDTVNPNVEMALKPTTVLRPYQEKSLRKMFGNGRARSGIIVLPCGAGKTLVGVTTACTVRKRCLVLCTSAVAVEQWRSQFLLWANIDSKLIVRFTSSTKDKPDANTAIAISTYSMVSFTSKRSYEAEKSTRVFHIAVMEFINGSEWADDEELLQVCRILRAKKNMTSDEYNAFFYTLVSQDTQEMYYSNKRQRFLVNQGYAFKVINRLEGMEEADLQYSTKAEQADLLQKVLAATDADAETEDIPQDGISRGKGRNLRFEKCICFILSQKLMKLVGGKGGPVYCSLTSLTFPPPPGPKLYEANWRELQNNGFIARVHCSEVWCPMTPEFYREYLCIRSRKRKLLFAMNPNKFRACRILRAKKNMTSDEYNAFFYTLVSQDTQEMYYSNKRQRFLVNQGYAFKVINMLEGMEEADRQYSTLPPPNDFALLFDCFQTGTRIYVSSATLNSKHAIIPGRILRAKKNMTSDEYNAFFYTLVSQDTQEMYYSNKRQRFLVNQGYAFKVINRLEGMEEADLQYSTKAEQADLLQKVLAATDADAETEDIPQDGISRGKWRYTRKHGDSGVLSVPSLSDPDLPGCSEERILPGKSGSPVYRGQKPFISSIRVYPPGNLGSDSTSLPHCEFNCTSDTPLCNPQLPLLDALYHGRVLDGHSSLSSVGREGTL